MDFRKHRDQITDDILPPYMKIVEHYFYEMEYASLNYQAIRLMLTEYYQMMRALEDIIKRVTICEKSQYDQKVLTHHIQEIAKHIKTLEFYYHVPTD